MRFDFKRWIENYHKFNVTQNILEFLRVSLFKKITIEVYFYVSFDTTIGAADIVDIKIEAY